MEDLTFLARFAWGWVQNNPLLVIAVVVGVVALRWLLNRKSANTREHDRVVKTLVEGSRGKYDDLRPLQ